MDVIWYYISIFYRWRKDRDVSPTMTLSCRGHRRKQSRQSARLFLQIVRFGNPHPPIRRRVCYPPPPPPVPEGGALSLAGEGVAVPIRKRGQTLWYLCTLCWRRLLLALLIPATKPIRQDRTISENANIAYLGSTVPSAQAHLLKSSLPLLGQGFTSIIIGSRSLGRATQNGGQVPRVKFPNQTKTNRLVKSEKEKKFCNRYIVLFILCIRQYIGRLGEKSLLVIFSIKSKVSELVLPDSEMRNLLMVSAKTSFSAQTDNWKE